jgi:hypothetical protein
VSSGLPVSFFPLEAASVKDVDPVFAEFSISAVEPAVPVFAEFSLFTQPAVKAKKINAINKIAIRFEYLIIHPSFKVDQIPVTPTSKCIFSPVDQKTRYK